MSKADQKWHNLDGKTDKDQITRYVVVGPRQPGDEQLYEGLTGPDRAYRGVGVGFWRFVECLGPCYVQSVALVRVCLVYIVVAALAHEILGVGDAWQIERGAGSVERVTRVQFVGSAHLLPGEVERRSAALLVRGRSQR